VQRKRWASKRGVVRNKEAAKGIPREDEEDRVVFVAQKQAWCWLLLDR
jgi:hypothetical protein